MTNLPVAVRSQLRPSFIGKSFFEKTWQEELFA